jgi:hypothetical protein
MRMKDKQPPEKPEKKDRRASQEKTGKPVALVPKALKDLQENLDKPELWDQVVPVVRQAHREILEKLGLTDNQGYLDLAAILDRTALMAHRYTMRRLIWSLLIAATVISPAVTYLLFRIMERLGHQPF